MELHSIDYAPHIPLYRQRRVRRVAIGIPLIIAIVLLARYAAPRMLRRFELHRLQEQAMQFSPAADQVAYDNIPTDFAGLPARPDYVRRPGRVWLQPIQWTHFYFLNSPPGRIERPTLFLHERRNSQGERRLVCIEGLESPYMNLVLHCVVFRPASYFSNPTEIAGYGSQTTSIGSGHSPMKIFAGQCDPADDSHFTITCEVDKRKQIIDGWLQDDDTVLLEKRLTIPTPSSQARSR